MGSTSRRFVGRRNELDRLLAFVDRIDRSGQAVLLLGDPGIGKTALIREVAGHAAAQGFAVAAIRGSEGESTVPYAGLHLMLQPYLADIDNLAEPQREALQIVFGLRQGEQPPSLLIGLATLSLLSDVAARSPLLVVAEDVHWLDEATRIALWFICRRITWEPILVTMTARPARFSPPEDPLIDRMTLRPLTFVESNELLDQRAERLTANQRRRVLEAAAGNPLALVELPPPRGGLAPETRLTARLEEAFADRFKTLDRAARIAVITVALNDRASLAEALEATAHATSQPPEPALFRRAAGIGLLLVDRDEVVFRHPLARSAVLQVAEPDEYEAGARSLVATLDPSRTAWLRAGLATALDEQIAAELELLGDRRTTVGDQVGAVSAYGRAAELSASPVARAHRLLLSAETAERGGDYVQATALLARLDELHRSTTPPTLVRRG